MDNDERRQKLIVMQSSLDRAVQIVLGWGGADAVKVSREAVTGEIKKTALELYNFVFDSVDAKPKVDTPPTPTQEQYTLLKRIEDYCKKQGKEIDAITVVWEKYHSFPKTEEAAKKIAIELGGK